ncbi:MAG: nuclear transport factor 2 family protein [Myxococcota bacterium]
MSNLERIAERLQTLEDIEAIKQTQYDYWRKIDLKLWSELGDCFTSDIQADYGRPDWRVAGRDALVDWLRDNEGGEHYSVSHAGHNPQVRLLSSHEATGFFKLHDWVRIDPAITLRGWGHYTNRFAREDDGCWRISIMHLEYVYKEEHYAYAGSHPPEMTPAMGR